MDRGQTFGTWVSPGEHVLILVFILAGLIFSGFRGFGESGRERTEWNGMGQGFLFFFLLFFFSCSFLIFNFCDSGRYQQGYLGVRGMWKLLS